MVQNDLKDGVTSSRANTSARHALSDYLPNAIVRFYELNNDGPLRPISSTKRGAALVADISGFTAISERLAQRGPEGAERLTEILNAYFGLVVDRLTAHGGDVVRFAGDALLAVWSAESDDEVEDATTRAAVCGLALQRELREYSTVENEQLSIKIGIGCGGYRFLHLGGVFDRWEYLVAGPAFTQAFAALDRADSRQVVVSLRSWALIRDSCHGQALAMGNVVLSGGPERSETVALERSQVRAAVTDILARFIPAAVTHGGMSGSRWLGEHRRLSVLFATLPELSYATPIDRAQSIMKSLQTEVYRFEGSINKLNIDDKGTSLLVAWGLPPLSHEDDPRRAVMAAMALHRTLNDLGVRPSIGVSTGRLFCGVIGGEVRKEYTLLGDVANKAARLMQAATDDILCDKETVKAAKSRVEFQWIDDIAVKGMSTRLPVYLPLKRRTSARRPGEQMHCRKRELEIVRDEFHRRNDSAKAGLIVIEGEAGIGKTRFLSDIQDRVASENAVVLQGRGGEAGSAELYQAWVPVIDELLSRHCASTPNKSKEEGLLGLLSGDSRLLNLAPLIRDALPLEIRDNDVTRHLTGTARGESTRELLVRLIQTISRGESLVIMIDDAHWQDTASWALASALLRQMPNTLLILAVRPFKDRVPKEFQDLASLDDCVRIRLEKLNRQDSDRLVAHCLDAPKIPIEVLDYIYERAEGNPFLSEEIALALKDEKHVRVSDGVCHVTNALPREWTTDLSDAMQAFITARIDRLGVGQQLTVKVGSVQGRQFTFPVLVDTYPFPTDRIEVRNHLNLAEQANLLTGANGDQDCYIFQHAMTQQVAYNLLLYSQRQQLHREIAQWYEADAQRQSGAAHATLARHWKMASEPARAIEYFDKSGVRSLRNGACKEAAEQFLEAIELAKGNGIDEPLIQSARRKRQLGESQLGLGRLTEGCQALRDSLITLGYNEPTSDVAVIAGIAGQIVQQTIRRANLARRRPGSRTSNHGDDVILEAARCYDRLAVVYYLSSEKNRFVYAALKAANLAEKTTPSPELARAYAVKCVISGIAGFHRSARRAATFARATARRLGDPPAIAWTLEVTSVYDLGTGRIEIARRGLEEAAEIFQQLCDWQHWGESQAAAAQASYYLGQFNRGHQLWRAIGDKAKQRGDGLHQAWGLNGQAEAELRIGRPGYERRAADALETAIELFSKNVDRVSVLSTHGLLAQAQLRCENLAEARQTADRGLLLADELGTPTGYYCLGGYTGIAMTYLDLWEKNIDGAPAVFRGNAEKAIALLKRYARVFRIGEPNALRCAGMAKGLARRRGALRLLHKSLVAAEQLQMPYETALAHLEIGRCRQASDAIRDSHLRRAIEIFERLGADYDGRLAECLLKRQ